MKKLSLLIAGFVACGFVMAQSSPLTPELLNKFKSLSPSQKGELSQKYNDAQIFKKMGFEDGKDAFTFCGAIQNYKLTKYSNESPPDANGNMMQKEMALTKGRRDNCQDRISELVQQGYWSYDAFGVVNKKYTLEISSASEKARADGGKKLGDMVALADRVWRAMVDTYPKFIAEEMQKR